MTEINNRRNRSMYCVIIGDIIKSKEIDSDTRVKVLNTVKDTFNFINTEYVSSLMAPFGIVRGDAFEGILLSQYLAPKIIDRIIKAFYSVEKTCVRISAVTDILTTIAYDRNENDGPAFHNALEYLDKMKKHEKAKIAEKYKENKGNHWLQVYINTNSLAQSIVESQIKLLIALTENWTDKQREVVWQMDEYSIEKNEQRIVGKLLGIPTSVVNKQLQAAHYETYRFAWDSLEKYLIAIDEDIVKNNSMNIGDCLAYYNTALRRYKHGKYADAILLLNKSLELSKESDYDIYKQIPIYNLLSDANICLHNYDKAKDAINESIRLQNNLPKARFQYTEALRIKSKIFFYKQEYNEADEYINEAIDIARNFLNDNHPYISTLNIEMKKVHNY